MEEALSPLVWPWSAWIVWLTCGAIGFGWAVTWARGGVRAQDGPRALGRRLVRGLGLALMLVPVAWTFVGIYNTVPRVVAGGAVLSAYSPPQLSWLVASKLVGTLAVLVFGFVLWSSDGTWRSVFASERELARRLAASVRSMTEGPSIMAGGWLFPALAIASILLALLLAGPQALNNGDESQVWSRMGIYHALGLSAAAAFSEEFLYRGLMLGALLAAFARLAGTPGRLTDHLGAPFAHGLVLPWLAAIVVQAVVFGFAHAGYGNWSHIIQAGAFGLVAGGVTWRWGIWAAIVLHFLADVYAFAGPAVRQWAPWGPILDVLFVALTLTGLARLGANALRALRRCRPAA